MAEHKDPTQNKEGDAGRVTDNRRKCDICWLMVDPISRHSWCTPQSFVLVLCAECNSIACDRIEGMKRSLRLDQSDGTL